MSKRAKNMNTSARREAAAAGLFIAPFMIGILVFNIYAFLQNFYISFTNKKNFGDYKFVGLDNYVKLFRQEMFYSSLGHTILYVVICVPIVISVSLVVAVALNRKIKGVAVYRTLIYLPMVTLPTAVGIVWKWLFNAQYGLINGILRYFDIEGPSWLTDSRYSLGVICVVMIWSSIANSVIIFLAGLQGISSTYYEASEIDGASEWQKFFKITIPLLSPTIFMMIVMQIIGFFQAFDMIYLMIPSTSSGLPGARSLVLLYYDETFTNFKKGYGASISIVLFVIIMLITLVQMKLQKKWVFDGEA